MNPDIQPHELADMRRAADKAPHGVQQKFHVLLDGYEDSETLRTKVEEDDARKEKVTDAVGALREVFPDEGTAFRARKKREEFGEPPSDDAWAECLADTEDPKERDALKDEELKRARAAEVALRARVEALEEAVESALEELE